MSKTNWDTVKPNENSIFKTNWNEVKFDGNTWIEESNIIINSWNKEPRKSVKFIDPNSKENK
tara:strand:+ start:458 stop:643 length:186 start_codon:yes stop_codon:yes gene_type:complete